LPEDRTLRADDVVHARFSLAVRGYRMSEVDAALDRLALEIAQRDARIEQLTGRPYETPLPGATADLDAHSDSPELAPESAGHAYQSSDQPEPEYRPQDVSDDAFRRPDPDAGP
jgi:DivIVA domain-containing protein